jgi:hypothetical protein
MTSRRGLGRVRVSRVWGVVTAVAALAANPPESWETVRSSLPPVAVAPNAPGVAVVPNRAVAPAIPLPLPMPPKPDRAVVPAANQVPALPASMPARPVTPAPSPAAAPAVPLAPALRAAPNIPRIPGKIGSPEAIGVPAATTTQVTSLSPTNTRVYVINGVDPFGWGGLSQMADRIRDSGYPDTKFGSWYQVLKFDRDIRAAHRQDPSAQFVIIGYSFGVYRAKALAGRLSRDGIPVAMVGYIGGDYLRNSPESQQAGGGRVVNVMGDGYLLTGRNLFFNGTDLSGADNVRMPGVRHFGLPKQEQTLNALVNGINSATGRAWGVAGDAPGIAGGGVMIPAPPATAKPTPTLPTTSAASPISTGLRR